MGESKRLDFGTISLIDPYKMYAITADYRTKGASNPIYYVIGKNKVSAKSYFKSVISWLNIYHIQQVEDQEQIQKIIDGWNCYKYSILYNKKFEEEIFKIDIDNSS